MSSHPGSFSSFVCFFLNNQFPLALCTAFSFKRLLSWLGALKALRLWRLGRFQRFLFCPRHDPRSHLGEATSDTCELKKPTSFHIPRWPRLLLLRVRRRFRDLLGHGRRLDLKGWTFRISNSSALGLSNVFLLYFFPSQHDSNTKQRQHQKTMSQEATGGSTGTGCDLLLGRIKAFPSFVETSVPFAQLRKADGGIFRTEFVAGSDCWHLGFWGHNAQPSKTTGQGTSIATEACWSCLGFWSSSALLTYSTWWCQAPQHPPAGGGSCGSTCL